MQSGVVSFTSTQTHISFGTRSRCPLHSDLLTCQRTAVSLAPRSSPKRPLPERLSRASATGLLDISATREQQVPSQTSAAVDTVSDANSSSSSSSVSEGRKGADAAGPYLSRLSIRDYALVQEQSVALQPGLNVITGESGAGKSVLMSAIGQILGAPASNGCVRPPAEMAVIEGTVLLGSGPAKAAMAQLLEQVGLPPRVVEAACGPAGKLHLKRELYSQGADGGVRSRCFVNSAATSLRVLREVGEALVDVNGQHAAQKLRDAGMQVQLLDRIAGTGALAGYFGKLLRKLREIQAQLATMRDFGSQAQRDSMQALVDHVRASGVYAGEERQLQRQLRAMAARRSCMDRCSLVHAALQGDGANAGLSEGIRDLELHLASIQSSEQSHAGSEEREEDADQEAGSSSPEAACRLMEEATEKLQDARQAMDAAEAKVAEYAQQFTFSQLDYDDVSGRRQLLQRLLKKHQCSCTEELLDRAKQAEAGLDRWFELEGQTAQQQALVAELRGKLAEAGAKLGLKRRAAAGKLRAAVESCLADLAMRGSRFDVRICWQAAAEASEGVTIPDEVASSLFESSQSKAFQATASGLDTVEFLLAAGPAEPLRPLASVASGGESSRIMLALKAAPAAAIHQELQEASGDEASASGAASELEARAETAAEAGVLMLDGVVLNLAATDSGCLGEFDLPSQGEDEQPQQRAQGYGPQILVLDELDSGVGGRLGTAVGQLLRGMVAHGEASPACQILCVSHLPQVAAHAQHHLAVRKALSSSGRMTTEFVQLVTAQDREHEVAAMLGLGQAEAQGLMQAAQHAQACSNSSSSCPHL